MTPWDEIRHAICFHADKILSGLLFEKNNSSLKISIPTLIPPLL